MENGTWKPYLLLMITKKKIVKSTDYEVKAVSLKQFWQETFTTSKDYFLQQTGD